MYTTELKLIFLLGNVLDYNISHSRARKYFKHLLLRMIYLFNKTRPQNNSRSKLITHEKKKQ